MIRRLGAAIYRGFFWTYERGTWQYDVMVAVILAFIFLTPRAWFHDEPSYPGDTLMAGSDSVVLLSSSEHLKVYQLQAGLIALPDGVRAHENILRDAERILQEHTGKAVQITQIKPET